MVVMEEKEEEDDNIPAKKIMNEDALAEKDASMDVDPVTLSQMVNEISHRVFEKRKRGKLSRFLRPVTSTSATLVPSASCCIRGVESP